MPRVNGVYELPPGSYGVPDTTIQSNKYNTVLADLAADANSPRPIGAGGTGATSAASARTALGLANAALTNVSQQWSAIQGFNNYTDVILRGGSGRSWNRFSSVMSIFESDGAAQIAIVAGTSPSSVLFGDKDAIGSGQIIYDHNIDRFQFVIGGTSNRLIINADGSASFAGAISSSGSPVATVYTGSTTFETVFPIGHTVSVQIEGSTIPTVNGVVTPRTIGSTIYFGGTSSAGTALSGVWRSRGITGYHSNGNAHVMAERVS